MCILPLSTRKYIIWKILHVNGKLYCKKLSKLPRVFYAPNSAFLLYFASIYPPKIENLKRFTLNKYTFYSNFQRSSKTQFAIV